MTSDGSMELLFSAFTLFMAYLLFFGLVDEEIRGRFTIYTRHRTPVRYWSSIAGVATSLVCGLCGLVAVATHLV